jgi:hypothetical protein
MMTLSMRRSFAAALSAAVICACASAASAANFHDFAVRNAGYHTIVAVYISDVDSDDWGEDQLDYNQVIEPGGHVSWHWNGNCTQDIKVLYDNGSSLKTRAYDTCTYNLRSTY